MKLAVLNSSNRKLGKVQTEGQDKKHFVIGNVKHFEFQDLNSLRKLIKTVAKDAKQCLCIGTFPRDGKVAPIGMIKDDMTMSRSKNSMSSGNILVVDNDTGKKFDSSIFIKHWSSAFKGAGYVRTKSGSTLLGKKKNGTHDYYVMKGEFNDLKTAMGIMEAICIVEGFYVVEFYATGRAVVKTPIDIKLNESQMIVYEDDVKPKILGEAHGVVVLSKLPNNHESLMKKADKIVKSEISKNSKKSLEIHQKWLKEKHKITGLKDNELVRSLGDYSRNFINETTKLFREGNSIGTVGDLLLGKIKGNEFADINEPEYGGGGQKAKFYGAMFHSQAHGGINYYIRLTDTWAKENRKFLGSVFKSNIGFITDDVELLGDELCIDNARAYPKQIDTTNKTEHDKLIVSAYTQVKGMTFWDGSILDYDMLLEISKHAVTIDGEFVVLPSMTHSHLFGNTQNIAKVLASVYPILQDLNDKGDVVAVNIKDTIAVIKSLLDMKSGFVGGDLNNCIEHSVEGISSHSIVGTALIKTIAVNKPTLNVIPPKGKNYEKIVSDLMATAFGNAESILKYALATKVIPQKKQFMVDTSASNAMKSELVKSMKRLGLLFEVKPDELLKSSTNKTAPQQLPKYWVIGFDDTVKVFKDSYYEIGSNMQFAVAYGRSTITVSVPSILVSSADGLSGHSEQRQNRTFDLKQGSAWEGGYNYDEVADVINYYMYELSNKIYSELIVNPKKIAMNWINEIQGEFSVDTVKSKDIVMEELGQLLSEVGDLTELKGVRYVEDNFIMVESSATPSSMLENLYDRSGNTLDSRASMYEFKNITWEDIGGVKCRLNFVLLDKQRKGTVIYLEDGIIKPLESKGRDSVPIII